MPQFEKIAEMIHQNGGVAIQQILHAGRYGGIDLGYCVQPSEVPQTLPHFRPPREMSREEIRQTVKEHGAAAKRAIKAGFDGVEITSFMGYMLANFLSSFTNKRTDEYGGSIENRARFMVEIIEEIKEAIGDRPLCVRLNGAELMDEFGGNTEEECLEMIRIAAETGGVDMISLVIGWQESRVSIFGRDVKHGHWNYLAKNAKQIAGDIPLAFGVHLPEAAMANDLIASGDIDFWEVCRPFLADPQRLHKFAEGREDEIKPCISCLLCLSRLFRDLPYLCTSNPALGHEVELSAAESEMAPIQKKIAVVGSGPAGLECALSAAKRGHEVVIIDKQAQLGGQLRLMAEYDLANKENLFKLLGYYETMLDKHGVEAELGTLVDRNFRQAYPDIDALVLATGAEIDRFRSLSKGKEIIDGLELLREKKETGKNVVVLGSGKVGLFIAENLARDNKNVTIIETEKRIAQDVIPTAKWRHISLVKELGIKTYAGAQVKQANSEGIVIITEDGKETLIEADTIISSYRVANSSLLDVLEFAVDEIY
ncbi:MAG: FAD-dependent oxidoreductase, partial [Firmicutes bacterium]|nr:FAD-dependent oxidoreductase [Bacillota bacterium]